MPKKAGNVNKDGKKLGRPVDIRPDILLDRYRSLKQFMENNWGRIGLKLQRVRKPEDVRAVLTLVPGIEFSRPFQDHPARCFLAPGDTEVGLKELGEARQQVKDAEATEQRLSLEWQSASQEAHAARSAFDATINQFRGVLEFKPFIAILVLVASELKVKERQTRSNLLEAAFRRVHTEHQELDARLLSQEGWIARNEIVEFAQNKRYEKTALNFAKVMAGLPEYRWLYSLRKCSAITDDSLSSTSVIYQLFELLKGLTQQVKPLSLQKIETRLRHQLLSPDTSYGLRAYMEPSWPYMKQAFADCPRQVFNRKELPYEIMGRFLANMERPKTPLDIELAKHEKLVDD